MEGGSRYTCSRVNVVLSKSSVSINMNRSSGDNIPTSLS